MFAIRWIKISVWCSSVVSSRCKREYRRVISSRLSEPSDTNELKVRRKKNAIILLLSKSFKTIYIRNSVCNQIRFIYTLNLIKPQKWCCYIWNDVENSIWMRTIHISMASLISLAPRQSTFMSIGKWLRFENVSHIEQISHIAPKTIRSKRTSPWRVQNS